MTKQEMQEVIETQSLETAVFESGLCQSWGDIPEFDSLYAALPDWLTGAIEDGTLQFDGNWDEDYWGSDSVVHFLIFPSRGCPAKLQEKLEAWKDDDAPDDYDTFCDGMESAAWRYVQRQDNFEMFDAIMRQM